MAKMAYIRQLLWKKHQSSLVEKLERRRRRNSQRARKSDRFHSFSAINFADPVAVAESAAAFKNRKVRNSR